jgi:apolipoprotein N-acyltransferase
MNKNIKWGGAIASLLLIFFCGLRMMQLPLWEWWSFGLQVGLWSLVIFLFEHKYNTRWLGLSSLSGLLLAVGFPPSPFSFTVFFGFIPLFFIVYEMWQEKNTPPQYTGTKTTDARVKFPIFRYAFNAFIVWNIGATWWVANAGAGDGVPVGMVAGLIANYLNAVFMATAFGFAFRTTWIQRGGNFPFLGKTANDFTFPIIFTVFWLSFEKLHLDWEISWPWLTLGNALADKPYLVQWYDTVGTLGGSLWILIVNVLAFYGRLYFLKNEGSSKRFTALALGAILIPMVISVAQYFYWGNHLKTGTTADVVSLQPNYEPIHEKFDVPETVQMPKFFRMARPFLDSTVDYLVCPETSFNFHNVDEWSSNTKIMELQNFVNEFKNLNCVLGVDALKIYAQFTAEKPQNLPKTVREFANRDGSKTYWEAYNAATQIQSKLNALPKDLPLYKKSRLVPGPEILPYGSLFGWLKPIFQSYGGTIGGLGYQDTRDVFTNQDGTKKVSPVICYESIYGDFCRGYVKNGAQALFVVTNDGWWGDTWGYKQHRAYARLRAIELRRSVVRSANTGSSCFINVRGDVEQATDYGVEAVIRQKIALHDGLTIYARTGDWVAWLAIGLFFVLTGMAVFKRFK